MMRTLPFIGLGGVAPNLQILHRETGRAVRRALFLLPERYFQPDREVDLKGVGKSPIPLRKRAVRGLPLTLTMTRVLKSWPDIPGMEAVALTHR